MNNVFRMPKNEKYWSKNFIDIREKISVTLVTINCP
jgi:hypothetical protein